MSEVAARLDAGTLDAAYVRPPLPLPDGVSTHTVHRDVFVVAVHGQSPLAARASIRPAALAGERFVVPEQALGTLEAARRGVSSRSSTRGRARSSRCSRTCR